MPSSLDRSNRVSLLKAAVFGALLYPGAWTALSYGLGTLGPRPLKESIDQTGLWSLRLLFVALMITPLRRLLQWPGGGKVRRMIGVAAFAYGVLHLAFYCWDENFAWGTVVSEIVLRFYLTIGFAGLLILAALAATSTDAMIRRLGGKPWQHLHRLTYAAGLLVLIHYFLQTNAYLTEPLSMTGVFAWLMGYRLLARSSAHGEVSLWSLAALTVVASTATALGEAGYFWLKLGVDPLRVLAANSGLAAGIRPSWIVLIVGGLIAAAAILRRRYLRTRRFALVSRCAATRLLR